MQLLMSPASPYARKARVLLREANLLDTVTEVEIATTPLNSVDAILAANPTGKIPALVRTDGPAIYDSRVITRFLNDHAAANLYPQSRIWEVLTLEATADAIMDSAISIVYELRFRDAAQHSPEWMDAQWGKVTRALTAINTRWMSHLNGPLDMAQVAVGCALGYLDFRHGDRDWRKGNAALADWYADFVKRDAMQATIPG